MNEYCVNSDGRFTFVHPLSPTRPSVKIFLTPSKFFALMAVFNQILSETHVVAQTKLELSYAVVCLRIKIVC